ncbi:hypothetical protein CsSME_00030647 [Camellia sinensis var. sinensis]|uniref:disease resistance RPP13-like protein 4 n=1 Tax=Camellia sinensis TaxID=4442 RepID=UPI0010367F25|nr:disease resistance RPP13-like protein 4 [Camellia sinensis]
MSIPSSSGTCDEIMPIEDTNHTFSSNNPIQIAISHNVNNRIEPTSNDDDDNNNNRSSMAEMLSKLIIANLNSLDKISKKIRKYEDRIKDMFEEFNKLEQEGGTEDQFGELKRNIMKLKQQISSNHEDDREESDPHRRQRSNKGNADNTLKNQALKRRFAVKEFRACYDQLDEVSRICLLFFSVFPENAKIKKRVMMYWWIGEGLMTTERLANELFNKFIVKGFIDPVCKVGNSSLGGNICKMDPLVRSMVIKVAKSINFANFDDDNDDNANATPRACLTGDGLTKIQDLEKLNTLFNVNEDILEIKTEYFSKMKNVKVLYLGRWQTSVSHHIEFADTKDMKKNANVLDGLGNLTLLRFLNLGGISRISELPESISKLTNLTILDIRACHNLEVIPDGIGLLKNLTHLDMSECYLLDQMPKALASLSKLQVLRGFLVSEGKSSCTLDDLRKFSRLRKLSIYAVVHGFPSDRDLCALHQFKALTKLTIVWARGSVQPTVATKKPSLPRSFTSKPAELAMLPLGLIKLDVQCFPWMTTPSWLRACNLKNLKKLCIRGGQFSDLGQKLDDKKAEKDKWEVEVLCLKYLDDLEMDWSGLQEVFPKLKFLEMVNCPKLIWLFPIDNSQVSMDSDILYFRDGIHISISYNDINCF